MNHILFGAKQVYLGTLRLTRDLLREFRLTPARYNLMFAIAKESRGLAQRDLPGILGVTSQTIGRMIRSLEILGFLRRTPHPRNPRHKWVAVTPSGTHHLINAIEDLVESVYIPWTTIEILNPKPGNSKLGATALRETDTLFNRMRDRLCDVATLRFHYDGPYARDRVREPPC